MASKAANSRLAKKLKIMLWDIAQSDNLSFFACHSLFSQPFLLPRISGFSLTRHVRMEKRIRRRRELIAGVRVHRACLRTSGRFKFLSQHSTKLPRDFMTLLPRWKIRIRGLPQKYFHTTLCFVMLPALSYKKNPAVHFYIRESARGLSRGGFRR